MVVDIEQHTAVRFQTLGALQIWHGTRECAPSTPKVLQVLGLLLVQANRPVPTGTLIDELWGDNPPRSAVTTIQTYVYQLRKLIEREGLAESGEDMLVTRPPGYLLRVRPGQSDLERFRELRERGRESLAAGRHHDAALDLRSALALWTGPPFGNVKPGRQLAAEVIDLEERHRTTLQLAIEAEMGLGMHRELVGELRSLTLLHPLDEWLHQQLMVALDRCGRRSEGVRLYWALRDALGDELGISPSPQTERIYRALLG
ncbi:AfsR/SARP family transcriptional regulator [Saccharothrix deserti]|uniref:AfsR/SARP family transcriptional regulator n=1 Tax=Saccharothrix deserti TaxID=2593674 RepID=UPI00131DC055|nr:AfsR/SARP family transcriptional regulator [Saccharothrix deserti]